MAVVPIQKLFVSLQERYLSSVELLLLQSPTVYRYRPTTLQHTHTQTTNKTSRREEEEEKKKAKKRSSEGQESHFSPLSFSPWQHTRSLCPVARVPHGPVVVFPRQFYIAAAAEFSLSLSLTSFPSSSSFLFDSFLAVVVCCACGIRQCPSHTQSSH